MFPPGSRRLSVAICCVFLALVVRAQEALPDGKGKDVVERMCGTKCHRLDVVTRERLSRQGWSNTVDTMVSRGATGTDDEIDLVVDYLAEHFGREKPASSAAPASANVNVNAASEKELAEGLELSADEAKAVVQYREKQGKFKNWDDLAKVPNLDVKKLEGKKDRIAF